MWQFWKKNKKKDEPPKPDNRQWAQAVPEDTWGHHSGEYNNYDEHYDGHYDEHYDEHPAPSAISEPSEPRFVHSRLKVRRATCDYGQQTEPSVPDHAYDEHYDEHPAPSAISEPSEPRFVNSCLKVRRATCDYGQQTELSVPDHAYDNLGSSEEQNENPKPESSQQAEMSGDSYVPPLKRSSRPRSLSFYDNPADTPEQGNRQASVEPPNPETSADSYTEDQGPPGTRNRSSQVTATQDEPQTARSSSAPTSYLPPMMQAINPLQTRRLSGEDTKSADRSRANSLLLPTPPTLPHPESEPGPETKDDSSTDPDRKRSSAVDESGYAAAKTQTEDSPPVQTMMPFTYPAGQQVSPQLSWPMGGMSFPPFQSVPLLTGGPILILATPQGNSALAGGQPLVQTYQPCPLAPPPQAADGRRDEYQMDEEPSPTGGKRLRRKREASVWLPDGRDGSPPSPQEQQRAEDTLQRMLDTGRISRGSQVAEDSGYYAPSCYSMQSSPRNCYSPRGRAYSRPGGRPRSPLYRRPSTPPLFRSWTPPVPRRSRGGSLSPVWLASPAGGVAAGCDPFEEDVEECDVMVDGRLGHESTRREDESSMAGGKRVVRRRQASIWLRDREDGTPQSLADVDEQLNRLLSAGLRRSSTPQGDRALDMEPTKLPKRKNKTFSKVTTTSRSVTTVSDTPHHTGTQTISPPSEESAVMDDNYSSSDDQEFEAEMKEAMKRILAAKRRHKDTPPQKPKHGQRRPSSTTWAPEREAASTTAQMGSFSLSDWSSTPESSSVTFPEQKRISFSEVGTPSRGQGKWDKNRDSGYVSEEKAVPERDSVARVDGGMSSLHQSMLELLQYNTKLQDQLLHSENLLQDNLNHLKEELCCHKLNTSSNTNRPQSIAPVSTDAEDVDPIGEFIQNQHIFQRTRNSLPASSRDSASQNIHDHRHETERRITYPEACRNCPDAYRNCPGACWNCCDTECDNRMNENRVDGINETSTPRTSQKGRETMMERGVGSSEAPQSRRDKPKNRRRDLFDRRTGSDEVLTSRAHRPRNEDFISLEALEGWRAESEQLVNFAASHWSRPSGSARRVENFYPTVGRDDKHSAERPYSPSPRKETSFERLVDEASALEENMQQELYMEVEQLRPAERVDSQGFELCSLCQHPHMTCGCGQGSENNNSDCHPPDSAEANPSSKRPKMPGSTYFHTRTVWHGGNRMEQAQEQPQRQPCCHTPPPSYRERPSTSHARPQDRTTDLQGEPASPCTHQWQSWDQGVFDREDTPQKLPHAEHRRCSGCTARSETYYEDDVRELPSDHSEKPKGRLKARVMRDQNITIYPRKPTDQMREPCKPQEGRPTSAMPKFTTEERMSTTKKEKNLERNDGVTYVCKHECRQEFNDTLKNHSCYDEEVIKTPKSQKIRTSSLEYSKGKNQRAPSTNYDYLEKKMTPATPELLSSSSDSKDLPSYVDHDYYSPQRNSLARERRRAKVRQSLSSEQLPRLSWPPNSPEYSNYSGSFLGDSAARGTRSCSPSPSPQRTADRGPWGSHASTRDTISPNRLPDQICMAPEDSISSHNTDGTTGSRDQGSISSFSRAMERTVGPKKERWKYERQKIHVKTFPAFNAMPKRYGDILQTDQRTPVAGKSYRHEDPANNPPPETYPTQNDRTPNEKHARNRSQDCDDASQRNASPSANLSYPRLLKDKRFLSNEQSWDSYTASGRRLPPPVSSEELEAGRYRSVTGQDDNISIASSTGSQGKRKKSKKKELPLFKIPKKHSCGCQRDSFAHPGRSPQPENVGRSAGQPEWATHFSRWSSYPSFSGSHHSRSGHRQSSASPRRVRETQSRSYEERRARSASSKQSRKNNNVKYQVARSQRSLTMARSLPPGVFATEDPYFADDDSWRDSETEQTTRRLVSQQQSKLDEYSSQPVNKRGEVVQKCTDRDIAFTSEVYEQESGFIQTNNETKPLNQTSEIPPNSGHQLEITIGIKAPRSFVSGVSGSEPPSQTVPVTVTTDRDPQCSSAVAVQPDDKALKEGTSPRIPNAQQSDHEAGCGPITLQLFSQENATFQSTMAENMEMMQRTQDVQYAVHDSQTQKGESTQSEKEKEGNIFIGIMIKATNPPTSEHSNQQNQQSNTLQDHKSKTPDQTGRDRWNEGYQDMYGYERREQSVRQVEQNVETIVTQNIQAVRGPGQPITEYDIEREIFVREQIVEPMGEPSCQKEAAFDNRTTKVQFQPQTDKYEKRAVLPPLHKGTQTVENTPYTVATIPSTTVLEEDFEDTPYCMEVTQEVDFQLVQTAEADPDQLVQTAEADPEGTSTRDVKEKERTQEKTFKGDPKGTGTRDKKEKKRILKKKVEVDSKGTSTRDLKEYKGAQRKAIEVDSKGTDTEKDRMQKKADKMNIPKQDACTSTNVNISVPPKSQTENIHKYSHFEEKTTSSDTNAITHFTYEKSLEEDQQNVTSGLMPLQSKAQTQNNQGTGPLSYSSCQQSEKHKEEVMIRQAEATPVPSYSSPQKEKEDRQLSQRPVVTSCPGTPPEGPHYVSPQQVKVEQMSEEKFSMTNYSRTSAPVSDSSSLPNEEKEVRASGRSNLQEEKPVNNPSDFSQQNRQQGLNILPDQYSSFQERKLEKNTSRSSSYNSYSGNREQNYMLNTDPTVQSLHEEMKRRATYPLLSCAPPTEREDPGSTPFSYPPGLQGNERIPVPLDPLTTPREASRPILETFERGYAPQVIPYYRSNTQDGQALPGGSCVKRGFDSSQEAKLVAPEFQQAKLLEQDSPHIPNRCVTIDTASNFKYFNREGVERESCYENERSNHQAGYNRDRESHELSPCTRESLGQTYTYNTEKRQICLADSGQLNYTMSEKQEKTCTSNIESTVPENEYDQKDAKRDQDNKTSLSPSYNQDTRPNISEQIVPNEERVGTELDTVSLQLDEERAIPSAPPASEIAELVMEDTQTTLYTGTTKGEMQQSLESPQTVCQIPMTKGNMQQQTRPKQVALPATPIPLENAEKIEESIRSSSAASSRIPSVDNCLQEKRPRRRAVVPQGMRNVIHHSPVTKQVFSPTTTLTVANHVYLSPQHPGLIGDSSIKKGNEEDTDRDQQQPQGHRSSKKHKSKSSAPRKSGKQHATRKQYGSSANNSAKSSRRNNSVGYLRDEKVQLSSSHSQSTSSASGRASLTWLHSDKLHTNRKCKTCKMTRKEPGSGENSECLRQQKSQKTPLEPVDNSSGNNLPGQESIYSTSVDKCLKKDTESSNTVAVGQIPSDDLLATSSRTPNVTTVLRPDPLPAECHRIYSDFILKQLPSDHLPDSAPSPAEDYSTQDDEKVLNKNFREDVVSESTSASTSFCPGSRGELSSTGGGSFSRSGQGPSLPMFTKRPHQHDDTCYNPDLHHCRKAEKLRMKLKEMKKQQQQIISQVKKDCVSLVDSEVKVKDAQLLEERISKGKLKDAIVTLQKQLTDMERDNWQSELSREAAKQTLARDKVNLENQLSNVQREADYLRDEKQRLESKLEKVEENKTTLQQQLTEARLNSSEKEWMHSHQTEDLGNYKNLVDLCYDKYQEERDTAIKLQEQLTEVSTKLEERDRESWSLKDQLEKAKSIISKRRRQVEKLKLMQMQLRVQCQQEESVSAVAMEERNSVQDKLHLETARYSSLLAQVDKQNERLMSVRSKVESLDPTRLKQQYEIRYQTRMDSVLRHINDILEQRAAVAEEKEIRQQEMAFQQRAHEMNLQILHQRNEQLHMMKEFLTTEARYRKETGKKVKHATTPHDSHTYSSLVDHEESRCVSPGKSSNYDPSTWGSHAGEHSHDLPHFSYLTQKDKDSTNSNWEPATKEAFIERRMLEVRLRALKKRVGYSSELFSSSLAHRSALPHRRISAVKAKSRAYLASIQVNRPGSGFSTDPVSPASSISSFYFSQSTGVHSGPLPYTVTVASYSSIHNNAEQQEQSRVRRGQLKTEAQYNNYTFENIYSDSSSDECSFIQFDPKLAELSSGKDAETQTSQERNHEKDYSEEICSGTKKQSSSRYKETSQSVPQRRSENQTYPSFASTFDGQHQQSYRNNETQTIQEHHEGLHNETEEKMDKSAIIHGRPGTCSRSNKESYQDVTVPDMLEANPDKNLVGKKHGSSAKDSQPYMSQRSDMERPRQTLFSDNREQSDMNAWRTSNHTTEESLQNRPPQNSHEKDSFSQVSPQRSDKIPNQNISQGFISYSENVKDKCESTAEQAFSRKTKDADKIESNQVRFDSDTCPNTVILQFQDSVSDSSKSKPYNVDSSRKFVDILQAPGGSDMNRNGVLSLQSGSGTFSPWRESFRPLCKEENNTSQTTQPKKTEDSENNETTGRQSLGLQCSSNTLSPWQESLRSLCKADSSTASSKQAAETKESERNECRSQSLAQQSCSTTFSPWRESLRSLCKEENYTSGQQPIEIKEPERSENTGSQSLALQSSSTTFSPWRESLRSLCKEESHTSSSEQAKETRQSLGLQCSSNTLSPWRESLRSLCKGDSSTASSKQAKETKEPEKNEYRSQSPALQSSSAAFSPWRESLRSLCKADNYTSPSEQAKETTKAEIDEYIKRQSLGLKSSSNTLSPWRESLRSLCKTVSSTTASEQAKTTAQSQIDEYIRRHSLGLKSSSNTLSPWRESLRPLCKADSYTASSDQAKETKESERKGNIIRQNVGSQSSSCTLSPWRESLRSLCKADSYTASSDQAKEMKESERKGNIIRQNAVSQSSSCTLSPWRESLRSLCKADSYTASSDQAKETKESEREENIRRLSTGSNSSSGTLSQWRESLRLLCIADSYTSPSKQPKETKKSDMNKTIQRQVDTIPTMLPEEIYMTRISNAKDQIAIYKAYKKTKPKYVPSPQASISEDDEQLCGSGSEENSTKQSEKTNDSIQVHKASDVAPQYIPTKQKSLHEDERNLYDPMTGKSCAKTQVTSMQSVGLTFHSNDEGSQIATDSMNPLRKENASGTQTGGEFQDTVAVQTGDESYQLRNDSQTASLSKTPPASCDRVLYATAGMLSSKGTQIGSTRERLRAETAADYPDDFNKTPIIAIEAPVQGSRVNNEWERSHAASQQEDPGTSATKTTGTQTLTSSLLELIQSTKENISGFMKTPANNNKTARQTNRVSQFANTGQGSPVCFVESDVDLPEDVLTRNVSTQTLKESTCLMYNEKKSPPHIETKNLTSASVPKEKIVYSSRNQGSKSEKMKYQNTDRSLEGGDVVYSTHYRTRHKGDQGILEKPQYQQSRDTQTQSSTPRKMMPVQTEDNQTEKAKTAESSQTGTGLFRSEMLVPVRREDTLGERSQTPRTKAVSIQAELSPRKNERQKENACSVKTTGGKKKYKCVSVEMREKDRASRPQEILMETVTYPEGPAPVEELKSAQTQTLSQQRGQEGKGALKTDSTQTGKPQGSSGNSTRNDKEPPNNKPVHFARDNMQCNIHETSSVLSIVSSSSGIVSRSHTVTSRCAPASSFLSSHPDPRPTGYQGPRQERWWEMLNSIEQRVQQISAQAHRNLQTMQRYEYSRITNGCDVWPPSCKGQDLQINAATTCVQSQAGNPAAHFVSSGVRPGVNSSVWGGSIVPFAVDMCCIPQPPLPPYPSMVPCSTIHPSQITPGRSSPVPSAARHVTPDPPRPEGQTTSALVPTSIHPQLHAGLPQQGLPASLGGPFAQNALPIYGAPCDCLWTPSSVMPPVYSELSTLQSVAGLPSTAAAQSMHGPFPKSAAPAVYTLSPTAAVQSAVCPPSVTQSVYSALPSTSSQPMPCGTVLPPGAVPAYTPQRTSASCPQQTSSPVHPTVRTTPGVSQPASENHSVQTASRSSDPRNVPCASTTTSVAAVCTASGHRSTPVPSAGGSVTPGKQDECGTSSNYSTVQVCSQVTLCNAQPCCMNRVSVPPVKPATAVPIPPSVSVTSAACECSRPGQVESGVSYLPEPSQPSSRALPYTFQSCEISYVSHQGASSPRPGLSHEVTVPHSLPLLSDSPSHGEPDLHPGPLSSPGDVLYQPVSSPVCTICPALPQSGPVCVSAVPFAVETCCLPQPPLPGYSGVPPAHTMNTAATPCNACNAGEEHSRSPAAVPGQSNRGQARASNSSTKITLRIKNKDDEIHARPSRQDKGTCIRRSPCISGHKPITEEEIPSESGSGGNWLTNFLHAVSPPVIRKQRKGSLDRSKDDDKDDERDPFIM